MANSDTEFNRLNSMSTNRSQSDRNKEFENVDEYTNSTSFRAVLDKLYLGMPGRIIDHLSTFFSAISFIVYIAYTYKRDSFIFYYDYIDWGIVFFYILEYILRFYISQHKLQYLSSWSSWTDIATFAPIIFLILQEKHDVLFNISLILRSIRVVRVIHRKLQIGKNEVTRQTFTIFLTVLTLIVLCAALLQAFEYPEREHQIKKYTRLYEDTKGTSREDYPISITQTSFFEMIYFVVVTTATVGYGDIQLISELGRLTIVAFIIIVIVLIPSETSELVRLMGMQSRYARDHVSSTSEVPHILVCGHLTVSTLSNFCQEQFHPDHGNSDTNAVILQHNDPSVEMEIFLHNPQYEQFQTYLKGNPLLEKDLKRAEAAKANACVVLTNKYVEDALSADHKNIQTGLSIKKYVHNQQDSSNNLRLCMQLIKPESKTHFFSSLKIRSEDQLIVVEEIKMNLLAKSCFCPGIITLLGNLIQSAGDQDIDRVQQEWKKEYLNGLGHEIYRTRLSIHFERKNFTEVAAFVYKEFQGILFGLELEIDNKTIVIQNPGLYEIPDIKANKVHVYVICEDKKYADKVSNYDMTSEEILQMELEKEESLIQKDEDNVLSTEPGMNGEFMPKEELDDEDLGFNDDDNELLETDYVQLDEPQSLINATMITIQNYYDVSNHIVVCGLHPSIYYFIQPLRASYLKNHQYIVILCPEPPQNEIWECINRFPKIIYIKGHPLLHEDLHRANITMADKAVIMGQSDLKNSDEMLDAESIFIYKAMKKAHKNLQIMIEIVHSTNIQFLVDKKFDAKSRMKSPKKINVEELKFEQTPLYAAGEIYISAIIDTLTCQSYYNPHIVTIQQQILTGGRQSSMVIMGICEQADIKQSNLWQIPVPKKYLNETFGDLFRFLSMENNLIALGLYRLPGSSDNKHPYVYTNPPMNVKLTHRDKVFVLGHTLPDSLYAEDTGEPRDISEKKNKDPDQNYENNNLKGHPGTNERDINPMKNAKMKNNGMTSGNEGHRTTGFTGKKKDEENKQVSQDLDQLNYNSAVYTVFNQQNKQLLDLQSEINSLKTNLEMQDEQIIDKVKAALRQEISQVAEDQLNLKPKKSYWIGFGGFLDIVLQQTVFL